MTATIYCPPECHDLDLTRRIGALVLPAEPRGEIVCTVAADEVAINRCIRKALDMPTGRRKIIRIRPGVVTHFAPTVRIEKPLRNVITIEGAAAWTKGETVIPPASFMKDGGWRVFPSIIRTFVGSVSVSYFVFDWSIQTTTRFGIVTLSPWLDDGTPA